MSDISILLLLAAIALIGGYVQGCIGFGVGTVGAPVIALADPSLMPSTILILGLSFSLTTALHERRAIRWRESALALLGRVPGTVLAVGLVALLPLVVLELVIAVAVLAAVALSAFGSFSVARNRRTLLATGMASGFGGTAAGIGGPPLALLYQDADGAHRRGTMAAVFTIGTLISILGLVLGGEFSTRAAGFGIAVLPFLAGGFALSVFTRGRFDRRLLRIGVLVTSGLAATVLLLRVGLGSL